MSERFCLHFWEMRNTKKASSLSMTISYLVSINKAIYCTGTVINWNWRSDKFSISSSQESMLYTLCIHPFSKQILAQL